MTVATKSALDAQGEYLTFSDVAKGLPGLKLKKARPWLQSLYRDMLRTKQAETSIAGVRVSREALANVFISQVKGTAQTTRVTPTGAFLLVELYLSNALPLQKGTAPGPVSAALLGYARYAAGERKAASKTEAAESMLAH